MSAEETSLRDLLFGATDRPGVSESPGHLRLAETAHVPEGLPVAIRVLLHQLFQNTQPFYVADATGKLVACSKDFAFLHNHMESASWALPELIAAVRNAGGEVRHLESFTSGSEIRQYDSRHFPIFNDRGDIVGFGGVYEDTSDLVRTSRKSAELENWLQDVIRSTSDLIWAIDHNYNLTFVSPRISDLLEEPPQKLLGRHLFAMGEFDAQDHLSSTTRHDISRHAPFRGRRFIVKTRRGETRYVLLSAVPIFDDDSGTFRGYRGTGTDISAKMESQRIVETATARLEETYAELRHRNDELRIALEHAKVADAAKLDFLAMISHELKTPLNSIIGFSDAAIQRIHGPIVGAYADYFENIHKAGRHLYAIINDLLEMASLERQEPTINLGRQSVQSLIDEAVALVDPQANAPDLDLSALKPKTPLVVQCDHLRARQILVNLLSNALKFTPSRGKIGIDVESRADGMVAITVWDTGIGIPADNLSKIFDKFYQVAQNVPSRGDGGTGLGLSISRHLAQLMAGDLTVTSVSGKGSRFTLTLPQESGISTP